MTKFYYTATKHRRLFAVFAIIIMAFAIFIPTTVDVFGFAAAVVPVIAALCAAVGISLAGLSAYQISNASNDIMFRSSVGLQDWIKMTAGGLVTSIVNPFLIPPALLKDFCTTVKGSVISGIDGITGYKLDTISPDSPNYNISNAIYSSANVNQLVSDFVSKSTVPLISRTFPYRAIQVTYIGNLIKEITIYCISSLPGRAWVSSNNTPDHSLFQLETTSSLPSTVPFQLLRIRYSGTNLDTAVTNPTWSPVELLYDYPVGSYNYALFMVQKYQDTDGTVSDFNLNFGLSSDGVVTNNQSIVDDLSTVYPVDKFGDTAITAGLDTAIDNVADFADAQAIEGVIDIPINIPVDDVGDFVIPIDPTDIIDIATPNPDPPPPDPDPDPPPKPPKPPTDLPDMDVPNVILDKFPFCIPFDLVKSFRLLSAPAVMPEFNIPFKFPAYNIDYTIHLDFKDFDKPIRVWKWFCSFLFVVGLIFLTRKIIGA